MASNEQIWISSLDDVSLLAYFVGGQTVLKCPQSHEQMAIPGREEHYTMSMLSPEYDPAYIDDKTHQRLPKARDS